MWQEPSKQARNRAAPSKPRKPKVSTRMHRPTRSARCLRSSCQYMRSCSRAFLLIYSACCCSSSGGQHLASGAFLPHHTCTTTAYTSIPGAGRVWSPSPSGPATSIRKTDLRLEANKSRGGRQKGRGGRGRRQQQQDEGESATASPSTGSMSAPVAAVPPPKSYRQTSLRIRPLHIGKSPTSSRSHIDIATYDIDDADWWEAKTLLQEAEEESGSGTTNDASENPFGTRAWPPSLVVAQLLVGLPLSEVAGRTIVELGCGTGLVSITAASLGAHAVATDISPLVLQLTRQGWENTRTRLQKAGTEVEAGTLSTSIFDVTSSDPLPIDRQMEEQQQQQPIVIATSVLYEADLAGSMANRVAEAAALGAWVIVGDCDSGQREGGRQRFEMELARRLNMREGGGDEERQIRWDPAVAKCPELGWKEKHVRLLHLNSPDGFQHGP